MAPIEENVGMREAALEDFRAAVFSGLATRALGEEAAAAIMRIGGALKQVVSLGPDRAARLPVCDRYLPAALDAACRHGPELARIADAFAAIQTRLNWAPRSAGGPHASANWPEGHANAMVFGPGGLEHRNDVQVGASLMAPGVRYPDHNHAPEEVYLVLSPGRFQHGDSAWFEPGIGGTLYNSPNIKHAMASDNAPLFALWFLWTGKPAQ